MKPIRLFLFLGFILGALTGCVSGVDVGYPYYPAGYYYTDFPDYYDAYYPDYYYYPGVYLGIGYSNNYYYHGRHGSWGYWGHGRGGGFHGGGRHR